ncbi:MAG TPA: hypothetical protein VGJ02_03060, partial [Pyrinomonadaceae bacterium]
MKSLITLGFLSLAMTFCGLTNKLNSLKGGTNTTSNSSTSSKSSSASIEKPQLSPAQQSIADSATETKWDEQGLSWKLPAGWKKTEVKKLMFDYSGPDNAFFGVNISEMNSDFPMDSSRQAELDQALEQIKSGHYSKARMLEIDGIPGVEFMEAPPEEKDGIRRYQWIGYRNYLGQNQMVNVMLSTSKANFDKHGD